jgi:hypothetical protein
VEITMDGGRLRGHVFVEKGGVEKGAQTIEATDATTSCVELVGSMALAVSVALDANDPAVARDHAEPTGAPEDIQPATSPPPAAPWPPAPSVANAEPTHVAQGSPILRPPRWTFLAGPGTRVSWGTWPAAALAPDFLLDLRSGRYGLGLELRDDLPVLIDLAEAERAAVGRWSGSLVPCIRFAWFVPCGVATIGATTARGVDVTGGTTSTWVYAAFGARAGVDIEIAPPLHLLANLDIVGIATPVEVTVGAGASSRRSFPVDGSAGATMLLSIF